MWNRTLVKHNMSYTILNVLEKALRYKFSDLYTIIQSLTSKMEFD